MSNLNQIKRPVITEKSTANAQFNKYVFEVDMKATKKDLKVIKIQKETINKNPIAPKSANISK